MSVNQLRWKNQTAKIKFCHFLLFNRKWSKWLKIFHIILSIIVIVLIYCRLFFFWFDWLQRLLKLLRIKLKIHLEIARALHLFFNDSLLTSKKSNLWYQILDLKSKQCTTRSMCSLSFVNPLNLHNLLCILPILLVFKNKTLHMIYIYIIFVIILKWSFCNFCNDHSTEIDSIKKLLS